MIGGLGHYGSQPFNYVQTTPLPRPMCHLTNYEYTSSSCYINNTLTLSNIMNYCM